MSSSTAKLQRFAHDSLLPHLAGWRMFNRHVGFTGDVGFWHETYVVVPGAYETVYGNMPRLGLTSAGDHVPVGRKGESLAERLGPGGGPCSGHDAVDSPLTIRN